MEDIRTILRDRVNQAEWIRASIEKLLKDPDGQNHTNAEIAHYMSYWMDDVNELFEVVSKAVELWDNAGDGETMRYREQMHWMVDEVRHMIDPAEDSENEDDDDYDEEDDCQLRSEPEEIPHFETMKYSLMKGLEEFSAKHPSPLLDEFKKEIESYLDDFVGGKTDKEFDISVSRRDSNGSEYIDFNFDKNSIEITYGGSVYDPAVGGDSYTNWDYAVWNDGSAAGDLTDGDFYNIYWMFAEAEDVKLTIEGQNGYYSCPDEDDDET